jgi:hypothetical protein
MVAGVFFLIGVYVGVLFTLLIALVSMEEDE